MAGFVQIIEYRTQRPDEVAELSEGFRTMREKGGDSPAPTRVVACADRDEPGKYYTLVEFASYEEAMENSNRSDTGDFAAKMSELCDGPPRFLNLDVIQTLEYS